MKKKTRAIKCSYLLEALSFSLLDFIIDGLPLGSLHLDLLLNLLLSQLLDLLKLGLEAFGLNGAGSLELSELFVLFAYNIRAFIYFFL